MRSGNKTLDTMPGLLNLTSKSTEILLKFLADETHGEKIRQHAEAELNSEGIEFIDAYKKLIDNVESFKKNGTSSLEELNKEWKVIYDTYIDKNSTKEINIPASLRTECKTFIDESNNPIITSANLNGFETTLTKTADNIINMIFEDVLPRYNTKIAAEISGAIKKETKSLQHVLSVEETIKLNKILAEYIQTAEQSGTAPNDLFYLKNFLHTLEIKQLGRLFDEGYTRADFKEARKQRVTADYFDLMKAEPEQNWKYEPASIKKTQAAMRSLSNFKQLENQLDQFFAWRKIQADYLSMSTEQKIQEHIQQQVIKERLESAYLFQISSQHSAQNIVTPAITAQNEILIIIAKNIHNTPDEIIAKVETSLLNKVVDTQLKQFCSGEEKSIHGLKKTIDDSIEKLSKNNAFQSLPTNNQNKMLKEMKGTLLAAAEKNNSNTKIINERFHKLEQKINPKPSSTAGIFRGLSQSAQNKFANARHAVHNKLSSAKGHLSEAHNTVKNKLNAAKEHFTGMKIPQKLKDLKKFGSRSKAAMTAPNPASPAPKELGRRWYSAAATGGKSDKDIKLGESRNKPASKELGRRWRSATGKPGENVNVKPGIHRNKIK